MKKDKCVYLHKDQDGVVRYVGHGTKKRAYVTHSYHRNRKWLNMFKESSPTVEIVSDNLTQDEALKLEIELFHKYRDSIVNIRVPKLVSTLDFNVVQEWLQIDSNSPTGLIWKKKPNKSNICPGNVAGSLLTKESGKKYWQVVLQRKVYKAHRLVWLLHNKSISEKLVIDHIDGNGLNNKVENLREVSQQINCTTSKLLASNKLALKNIVERKTHFLVTVHRNGISHNRTVSKKQSNPLKIAVEIRDNLIKELDFEK